MCLCTREETEVVVVRKINPIKIEFSGLEIDVIYCDNKYNESIFSTALVNILALVSIRYCCKDDSVMKRLSQFVYHALYKAQLQGFRNCVHLTVVCYPGKLLSFTVGLGKK